MARFNLSMKTKDGKKQKGGVELPTRESWWKSRQYLYSKQGVDVRYKAKKTSSGNSRVSSATVTHPSGTVARYKRAKTTTEYMRHRGLNNKKRGK